LTGLVVVSDDARRLGVKLAYSVSWGVPVKELDSSKLSAEAERLREEITSKYTLENLKNDPVVRAYRDFYWRIGIDPTKTRPSSEALVRRLLRGKWPKINPVVDAGNIASARHLVPIGIYDLERFTPPARIVLASGGEVFEPIGGEEERVPANTPIMVDSRGVVMHLYPHRDSRITMVRPETRCVLVVAAGVPGVSMARLKGTVAEVQRLLGVLGWHSCDSIEIV
jgi:DNA/RNA-binding domain of Phe-tRNA-synthetase-like protein